MKYTSSIQFCMCAAFCLAFSVCGGSGGGGANSSQAAPTGSLPADTPTTAPLSLKEQITRLEDSGKLPKLDRSTSILGPDVNSNGVRDDIEAYIASLPLTEVQKKAVMQKAKALQMTLTVDLTDKLALQKVGDALSASTNCLSDSVVDFSSMAEKIEGLTANTKERAKQYIKFNAASSGSVTSSLAKNYCAL